MGEAFETVRGRNVGRASCRVVPRRLSRWRHARGNPRLRQLRDYLGGHHGRPKEELTPWAVRRRGHRAALAAQEAAELVVELAPAPMYDLASLVLDELAGVVTSVTEGGSFSYHPVTGRRRS